MVNLNNLLKNKYKEFESNVLNEFKIPIVEYKTVQFLADIPNDLRSKNLKTKYLEIIPNTYINKVKHPINDQQTALMHRLYVELMREKLYVDLKKSL